MPAPATANSSQPRPLLPLRQSDLLDGINTSDLELLQTMEHLEILRRYTGYNKQATKTRGTVLGVLALLFVLFGFGSGFFVLGEDYSIRIRKAEANGVSTQAQDDHSANRPNNKFLMPPSSSSAENKNGSPTKTTSISSNNNGTRINTTNDPQISVISNLTQPTTKGPKIPKDIISINPTEFLHIAAGQHIKHWHLNYLNKECRDEELGLMGHRVICEFRDQKFAGYASTKSYAKTIASRKAVEYYYNVRYPSDSRWGAIIGYESLSTYC